MYIFGGTVIRGFPYKGKEKHMKKTEIKKKNFEIIDYYKKQIAINEWQIIKAQNKILALKYALAQEEKK
jgi:hypothetical protein